MVDAAILRAGWLDRHVEISLPEQSAREAIFRMHLHDSLGAEDYRDFAAATSGLSGAERGDGLPSSLPGPVLRNSSCSADGLASSLTVPRGAEMPQDRPKQAKCAISLFRTSISTPSRSKAGTSTKAAGEGEGVFLEHSGTGLIGPSRDEMLRSHRDRRPPSPFQIPQ